MSITSLLRPTRPDNPSIAPIQLGQKALGLEFLKNRVCICRWSRWLEAARRACSGTSLMSSTSLHNRSSRQSPVLGSQSGHVPPPAQLGWRGDLNTFLWSYGRFDPLVSNSTFLLLSTCVIFKSRIARLDSLNQDLSWPVRSWNLKIGFNFS